MTVRSSLQFYDFLGFGKLNETFSHKSFIMSLYLKDNRFRCSHFTPHHQVKSLQDIHF